MRHQKVGAIRRCQRVFVGLPQDRHDDFPDDAFTAHAPVHQAPDEGRVGLQVGQIGADSTKADAQRLDLLPVVSAGGDDCLVTSCLQAQGDGDVGVQIAQGAERREDDPAPAGCCSWFLC
jgi:hypothetical protein